LRTDLSSEIRSTLLSLLTLLVGLACTGWFLAVVYVQRPLRTLVQTMHAVRSGDLSAKASLLRTDEIGAAIMEFNALVKELAEARRRLLAETEARETMEINLRRVDRLVTVGQLSAGLAHEIGSPLQILNGRARTLAAKTDLPPEVRRIAGILASESDRVTRIVEQLLTFSRRSAPRSAPAELGSPVGDIVELFEHNARRQAVRLEFECEPSLPMVIADVGQVQQVLINLLSNAVRAVSRHGGQVRVALKSSAFECETGESLPSVSLVVEDTGSGIRPDLLPHIFEPFFTTHAEAGGTGLGLAVVKSIVDAHGGVISVTSGAGEGTRFTVHFPISGARAAGRTA
jgi:signal transduction histidine kinase